MGGKKASEKKGTAKDDEPKKGGSTEAAETFMGDCLSLKRAGHIVLDATENKHQIDEKLGDFLTEPLRRIFQKDVFDRIEAAGCLIDIQDIPNGAGKTLQDVQLAIKTKARKPKPSQ